MAVVVSRNVFILLVKFYEFFLFQKEVKSISFLILVSKSWRNFDAFPKRIHEKNNQSLLVQNT